MVLFLSAKNRCAVERNDGGMFSNMALDTIFPVKNMVDIFHMSVGKFFM